MPYKDREKQRKYVREWMRKHRLRLRAEGKLPHQIMKAQKEEIEQLKLENEQLRKENQRIVEDALKDAMSLGNAVNDIVSQLKQLCGATV